MSDHDRPLNGRGQRDSPRIGELIDEQGITPDCIISSTAMRAKTTATLVAEHCGYHEPIRFTAQLYEAYEDDYFAVLHELEEEIQRVMIVAHNPTIEDVLHVLSGEHETMATATLAQIELPIDKWSELDTSVKGRLVRIWRPKEID